MNPPESNEADTNVGFERAKTQREQALACLVLAGTIALAVGLSVLAPAPEIDVARAAVEAHRGLARESQTTLESNRAALHEAQRALEAMLSSAPK
jgi:hypothetical protein